MMMPIVARIKKLARPVYGAYVYIYLKRYVFDVRVNIVCRTWKIKLKGEGGWGGAYERQMNCAVKREMISCIVFFLFQNDTTKEKI
jgi:hypothetical protein